MRLWCQTALERAVGQYPDSELTMPFRFNAFYPEASVTEIDAATWKLAVSGRVEDKGAWPLEARLRGRSRIVAGGSTARTWARG